MSDTGEDQILEDAIHKHQLHALEGYDKQTLINLIRYAKVVGYNEGWRDGRQGFQGKP